MKFVVAQRCTDDPFKVLSGESKEESYRPYGSYQVMLYSEVFVSGFIYWKQDPEDHYMRIYFLVLDGIRGGNSRPKHVSGRQN